MTKENRSAIIISASSDIGSAISRRWQARGWSITGTYRTKTQTANELLKLGIKLIRCDLSNSASIHHICSKLRKFCPQWDVLVMCPGVQDPIGSFVECNFEEWEKSVKINFTNQMRVAHELLSARRINAVLEPCVLFFAGGGTNSAPINYSAYTVSKIALIKMCELLDAELPDVRFVIVGPGWVKTKIHESTLKAGEKAGANYQRTIDKLAGDECTPMEKVLDCCDWLVESRRELISGRNFSVVFDKCGTEDLEKMLLQYSDMYKLRRYGNEWKVV